MDDLSELVKDLSGVILDAMAVREALDSRLRGDALVSIPEQATRLVGVHSELTGIRNDLRRIAADTLLADLPHQGSPVPPASVASVHG